MDAYIKSFKETPYSYCQMPNDCCRGLTDRNAADTYSALDIDGRGAGSSKPSASQNIFDPLVVWEQTYPFNIHLRSGAFRLPILPTMRALACRRIERPLDTTPHRFVCLAGHCRVWLHLARTQHDLPINPASGWFETPRTLPGHILYSGRQRVGK